MVRIEPQETIWAAVRSCAAWISSYGMPLALYTDWKNVYVREPTEADLPPVKRCSRSLDACAHGWASGSSRPSSPEAKGRVERKHGTHQDRLVKKLRRRRIGDYASANAFLATTYVAEHNARFARPAASPDDFHTPLPASLDLDQVFRLETARTVTNDWVVRHDNRLLQIERRGRQYPPARSTVLVCEYEDGHLEVWYREHRVPWTDITGRTHAAVALAPPRPALAPPPRPVPPKPQHPWKRSFRDLPDRLSPGERIPGHVAPTLYGGAT